MTMKKEQRVYLTGTYTPKKSKNYLKRSDHEMLLRKLSFELTRTPLTAPLDYLTDYELLTSINKCLASLGLITMDEDELNRELSLKN